MSTENQIKACLFGGAIGDALGAPVEFLGLTDIEEKYGKFTELLIDEYEKCALITDDTQMTIMTAYGIINAKNKDEYLASIFNSYVKWAKLLKNGFSPQNDFPKLSEYHGLFEDRDVGATCMESLLNADPNTIGNPIYDKKGNGGVMRAAPIGLVYSNPEEAFIMGMKIAHLTHEHSTSDISTGAFTALISLLLNNNSLETSIEKMIHLVEKYDENKETLTAIQKAIEYANDDNLEDRLAIFKLGLICDGFIAEEALAIALYCILTTDNYKDSVIKSVNISGDSDTIGAICGNIAGLVYGFENIPSEWVQNIEFKTLLKEISSQLYDIYIKMSIE